MDFLEFVYIAHFEHDTIHGCDFSDCMYWRLFLRSGQSSYPFRPQEIRRLRCRYSLCSVHSCSPRNGARGDLRSLSQLSV